MGLPRLREELSLLPGPTLGDGQPSWTLHDPVRNQFIRIYWPTHEILMRWPLDNAELIASTVSAETVLTMTGADIEQVVRFLQDNQLLLADSPDSAKTLADRLHKMQGGVVQWLLHHYLFFRIPLWQPDAWLERHYPIARLFFTKTFLWITLLALGLGAYQVARQWDVFLATLADTMSWSGLAAYGIALALVKLLHELGHAFTAKRYGCRVPAIGVAFLVMWPVAYTDTNETWRLTDRWQRLHVAIAGIATELLVAAWATFAWTILPEGTLRTAAFVLATTSWIASLVINASPFMRFDGYFILSDWLDMPNLHARSFALARWHLRERLFDLGAAPPEQMSTARRGGLIAFAWVVWLYRLTVFLGIAALVYHFAFKLLGILLFVVEILWFVLLPIRQELGAWKHNWASIRSRPRWRRSAMVFAGFVLLGAIPWPSYIVTSGMLRPLNVWPVYAPAGARIEALPPHHGEDIAAGQDVLRLFVPELLQRRQALLTRTNQLRKQVSISSFDEQERLHLRVNEQTLAGLEAELAGIDTELSTYAPKAPFSGKVYTLDPDLHPGQWVARREKVALLVHENSAWRVDTWVDEDTVQHVHMGDSALFVANGPTLQSLPLKVLSVDKDANRSLTHPELTTQFGGHIVVREKAGQLIPERAMYRIVLEAPADTASQLGHITRRGDIHIHGDWEVPAWRYIRQFAAVLLRELGF